MTESGGGRSRGESGGGRSKHTLQKNASLVPLPSGMATSSTKAGGRRGARRRARWRLLAATLWLGLGLGAGVGARDEVWG